MMMKTVLSGLLVVAAVSGCRGTAESTAVPDPDNSVNATQSAKQTAAPSNGKIGTDPGRAGAGTVLAPRDGDALAAFAAGCFWGVEDVFRHVPGVVATAVGFSGGHTEYPTYPAVCTHTTGHAETVLVEFDPKRVSYETLLNVFFKNHDPTQWNRQGPDEGDQYRSEIFTFSADQAAAANAAKDREASERSEKVVTLIEPMTKFWIAEDYHQQYDEKTGTHSCPLPKGLPRDQGT
jgi:peptide-methionine (S)-S-oxide reductase